MDPGPTVAAALIAGNHTSDPPGPAARLRAVVRRGTVFGRAEGYLPTTDPK